MINALLRSLFISQPQTVSQPKNYGIPSRLPPEIWWKISSHLPLRDAHRLARTHIISHDSPTAEQSLIERVRQIAIPPKRRETCSIAPPPIREGLFSAHYFGMPISP